MAQMIRVRPETHDRLEDVKIAWSFIRRETLSYDDVLNLALDAAAKAYQVPERTNNEREKQPA